MNNNATELPFVVRVVGPWRIEVEPQDAGADKGERRVFDVAPSEIVAVERERYDRLPVFDPAAPGWKRGQRLLRCQSQETSVKDGVVPGSLKVFAAADTATPLRENRDYRFDTEWATIGLVDGGAIDADQPVWVSYACGLARIDSVMLTASGDVAVQRGESHVCAPRPPASKPGDRSLANIWIPPRLAGLSADHLLPVLETRYPAPPPMPLERSRLFLPQTWRKLESGGTLRILAWGDSVTDAYFLKGLGYPAARWQEQFTARLRKRFPQATIELVTAAWGAHNSKHFVDAPPEDAEHHYETVVLGAKPDLIVSEFVNDANLRDPAVLECLYNKYRDDFRRIGAEWIMLTPHYVRPDRMGLKRERLIDDDPRPYVANLRAFAAQNRLALADASKRWGRLWRQGIPYSTLLLNAINHPDERGMAMFADSLMEWFPEPHGTPANAP
jgi:hypothetical protein